MIRAAGRLAALPRAAAFAAGLAATACPATAALAIDRFTTAGPGSVNSYLIETSAGTVVIDAQRQAALGRRLAAEVDPPLAGILLTHPHPDHVGGLAALMAAYDAPLFASRATADEMIDDTRGLLALSSQTLGAEFPAVLPRIDDVIASGDRLRFGDVTFEVYEYGPSEAATMTMYYVDAEDVLFAGDLLSPDMTPFLLEKRTLDWIAQLQDLAGRFPSDTRVFPGHGPTGELGDMIARQIEYLQRFRALVSRAVADGQLSDAETDQIATVMRAAYPDHDPVADLPNLLERNVRAVAAELLGDPGAPPVATIGD